MSLAINLLLWIVVGILMVVAGMRSRAVLTDGLRHGGGEVLRLLPRICIGVVGSGFIAEAMPKALIVPWIGPQSGLTGVLVSIVAGALTPGGPVVGFAIARRGAQERRRRAAGDRLFDRLGVVRDPPAGALGSADDAGAAGLVARIGVGAPAVHRRRAGDGLGQAVSLLAG